MTLTKNQQWPIRTFRKKFENDFFNILLKDLIPNSLIISLIISLIVWFEKFDFWNDLLISELGIEEAAIDVPNRSENRCALALRFMIGIMIIQILNFLSVHPWNSQWPSYHWWKKSGRLWPLLNNHLFSELSNFLVNNHNKSDNHNKNTIIQQK